MKSRRLFNERVLQILDQILAASLSYLCLIPFLLLRDFEGIAKMSAALACYTFYLGCVRIFIINNILDERLVVIETKQHLRRSLFLSISGFICVPLHDFLNLTLFESGTLSILIVVSMRQEVMRQTLLSKKAFSKAIVLDLLWLATSAFLILGFVFLSSIQVSNVLFSWLAGAMASVIVARRFQEGEGKSVIYEDTLSPLGFFVLIIPVLTTLHTLFFNYFLFSQSGIFELALLRSIQFMFLPAIFLINIQQNFFVPAISSGNLDLIKILQQKFNTIQRFILVCSVLMSLVYIIFVNAPISDSYLILLVSASVYFNTRIGSMSLHLIVKRKIRILIVSRFSWLLVCLILMFFLRGHIGFLLLSLCVVDFFLLSYFRLVTTRLST